MYIKLFIWTNVFYSNLLGQNLLPVGGQWACNAGPIKTGYTLNGGIHAGRFTKFNGIKTMDICVQSCCKQSKCDVAFMARDNCYLVSCNNRVLCRPIPAKSIQVNPKISYVTHHMKHGLYSASSQKILKNQEIHIFSNPSQNYGAINPNLYEELDNKNTVKNVGIHSLTKQEKGQKRVVIEKKAGSKSKVEKIEEEETIKTKSCYPAKVHNAVSLKYGPNSGEFYDYGKIGSMRQCISLCCKDKSCDVVFMVADTCYTLNCYSFEKCDMIPAGRNSKLKSQLAYVIKKKDTTGQQKLKVMKKEEEMIEKDKVKNPKIIMKDVSAKKHDHISRKIKNIQNKIAPLFKSNRDQYFTEKVKEKEIETQDTNIPESLTKNCNHGDVFINHMIIGGLKSGIYNYRGVTPGFHECLRLCCTDTFCDAAFLLGKRCYSVQCYRNKNCASKPAKSGNLNSQLAFLRQDNDIDNANSKFYSFSVPSTMAY